jgi:hypothetical protein
MTFIVGKLLNQQLCYIIRVQDINLIITKLNQLLQDM